MPFHHVTAGLLYKGNYLNRSLSAGSDSEQLANISVEELDGKRPPCRGDQPPLGGIGGCCRLERKAPGAGHLSQPSLSLVGWEGAQRQIPPQ